MSITGNPLASLGTPNLNIDALSLRFPYLQPQPHPATVPSVAALYRLFADFAHDLESHLPSTSRHKSLAFSALEEAQLWALKAAQAEAPPQVQQAP